MKHKLLAAFLGLTAVTSSVTADDLGVQGNVWTIVEIDVRQLLVASAARADWSKAQDQLKNSAKNYLANLPKRTMPIVDKTQTVWFDPSIVLSSDIQAPVQQLDGTYRWQILFAKGTKVNPLSSSRPATAMLFFDGADPAQLSFVKQLLEKESLRIVPIESGAGNIGDTNEYLNRTVYHANEAMINRFQVKYLPTLVYPGEGPNSLALGISSFSLPFNADAALSLWKQYPVAELNTSGKKQ